MNSKIKKSEVLSILRRAKDLNGYIEYDNNYFKINIQGEIVSKQDEQATLKAIYDLTLQVNVKIENLEVETNKKFDLIDKRLDQLEFETHKRFESIGICLVNIDNKIEKLEGRMDKLEVQVTNIENRLDKIENEINIIKKLPTISEELIENN